MAVATLAVGVGVLIVTGLLLVARTIITSRIGEGDGGDNRGDHGDDAVVAYNAGGEYRRVRDRRPRVSAVVITLNEATQIRQCLDHLLAARPAFHEVIVIDGGSSDDTVGIAAGYTKRTGMVRVHVSATRGRAAQLNAGLSEVTGDAVVFVHADSRPPRACVQEVCTALFNGDDRDEPTVIGLLGFPTRIAMFDEDGSYSPASETRILWITTMHEYIAYFFYPLLFQPISFLRGLRCLFGDQNLSLRTVDGIKLGGFDDTLRIMEDLDLCLRVVEKLGKRVVRSGRWGASSGRRIAQWGELNATYIHFRISLVWYMARLAEWMIGGRWPWVRRLMGREYEMIYTDDPR